MSLTAAVRTAHQHGCRTISTSILRQKTVFVTFDTSARRSAIWSAFGSASLWYPNGLQPVMLVARRMTTEARRMARQKENRDCDVRSPALHPFCYARLRWASERSHAPSRLDPRREQFFGSLLRLCRRSIPQIPIRQKPLAGFQFGPTSSRTMASSGGVYGPTTGSCRLPRKRCSYTDRMAGLLQ